MIKLKSFQVITAKAGPDWFRHVLYAMDEEGYVYEWKVEKQAWVLVTGLEFQLPNGNKIFTH